MADARQDIRSDLEASRFAARTFTRAMREFEVACLRGDWEAAEAAHQWAVGALGAHLDARAAAFMRMAQ